MCCGQVSKYRKIKVNGKAVDEHRHIMEQHIGRKLSRHEVVHHINGDGHDNRLENLEIKTLSEHSQEHMKNLVKKRGYAFKPEHIVNPKYGSECNGSKLTEAQVLDIRARNKAGETQTALAKEYGVHITTLNRIIKRHSWRHI
jgi:hypothetical protein